MFAVGLDNVAFWTIVLFLLCYIPMLGVTVGSIVPALFALLQFASWWQAAVVFGGIQVVAFIVGNFIYPRMQAESQNIAPVATLLSLAFWGSLWGLTGAFLAVPLTLMVMMICAYFPRTRWVAVLLSNDGEPAFPERYPDSGSKGQPRRCRLAQLADLQPVLLGPRLDRFLAARHRLADRLQAHALGRQAVELLDFVAGPRLAVALGIFRP